MRWKYRIGAVVATAGIGIAALLVLPGSAHAATTLRFVARQTNAEFVIDGKATLQPPQAAPSPGDHILFRDDLLQSDVVIGFDNVDCIVTFNNNLLCTAIVAINNKGDIFGAGLLRGGAGPNGPTVFDIAVTGGTFAYRNAHGDAHAVQINETDTSFTLNLVMS